MMEPVVDEAREGEPVMITPDEAASIAERVVGAPADDPGNGWTLEEFQDGWLIYEKAAIGLMGPATRVVEKSSGRVISFPSSVSLRRIRTHYAETLADAFPVD